MGVDLAIHSHLVLNLRRAVEGSIASKGNKESLKKEIAEARAARDRLAPLEREVLRLIASILSGGGKSPHKLIHDLRNVLNEVGLLKVITDRSY